jgi:GST-like protein
MTNFEHLHCFPCHCVQFGHFYKFGKDKCDHPYPLQRYSTEVKRLLGVLEERLEGQQFLVGNEYSIADMATAPWIRGLDTPYGATEYLGLSNYPRVLAWKDRCLTRPATARGLTVCSS